MDIQPDLDSAQPSEDVDMEPACTMEPLSNTLMNIEVQRSRSPTASNPTHASHLIIGNPASSSDPEDPCTRTELFQQLSDDEMIEDSKGNCSETRTKIRIVENDQTVALHSRLARQHYTHSKRSSVYKSELKQVSARYDQLFAYTGKQQEMLDAYTQQLIVSQQQLVELNAAWDQKLAKQQAQLVDRERQSVSMAENRLLQYQVSSEEKINEQNRAIECLRKEINELKNMSAEKNNTIADLTTKLALTQKKASNYTYIAEAPPSMQATPTERRGSSPPYSPSIQRRQNVCSPQMQGRTMLQIVSPQNCSEMHVESSMAFSPAAQSVPVHQCDPATPTQSTPATQNALTDPPTLTAIETLLSGFKDMFSQLQRPNIGQQPNPGNASFGRRKTKAKERLEGEVKSQDKDLRRSYLHTCREICQTAFSIEQDQDIIYHIPPTPEEVRSVREGDTRVEDVSRLLLDMNGKIGSEWNRQVMAILCGRIKEEVVQKGLAPCSDAYMANLIQERITKLRNVWRKVRPKVDETGIPETADELEDRIWRTNTKTAKSMRHLTRRTSKYECRQRIVINTIIFKETAGDSDVALWKWLQEVLKKLTVDGMSSEESDGPDSLQKVFRVKILPWRRNIEQELRIIDHERRTEMAGFSRKGSVPSARNRNERNLVSDRKPVTGLPRVFYDDDWFEEFDTNCQGRTISVSEEQFHWISLMAEKSGG